MITLQFSAQSNIGSWLIRKGTWSPYSHVDFVLSDGSLLGAKFHGGVALRQPEETSKKARYSIEAPDSILDMAYSQLGKPYDWTAILGFIYRRDWQKPDAWFCSELIAWAFAEAGHPLLATEPSGRITPRDLLLSPWLNLEA